MERKLAKIYAEVADTYELVNHILTFGLDYLWRKKSAKALSNLKNALILDVCSGTGEFAAYINKMTNYQNQIVCFDQSCHMLKKALKKYSANNVLFINGLSPNLPFPDNTFDAITISFATRNLNSTEDMLIKHIKEFHRVLKPNGKFLNLETSQPNSKIIRELFHLYVKLAVKPIGSFISGSKTGYAYLSHTIPRFYNAKEFSSILNLAGFKDVVFKKMLCGVSSLHIATK